jgi:hypothetical protein
VTGLVYVPPCAPTTVKLARVTPGGTLRTSEPTVEKLHVIAPPVARQAAELFAPTTTAPVPLLPCTSMPPLLFVTVTGPLPRFPAKVTPPRLRVSRVGPVRT